MTGLEHLLEEDQQFLERKNWDCEIKRVDVGNGTEIHIVVRNFKLPPKFSPASVDLLVRQYNGYPEAGMDMFWTRPDVILAETKQKPPATETTETHGGLEWQRWSRHMNGWRAGTDNLETFFAAIVRELNR